MHESSLVNGAEASPGFLFTAVIAAYNVGRYLDDLFASFEAQTFNMERVQLVFVDDGSTDDTLLRLRSWASGRGDEVVVVTQPNAWVAAARNTGLQLARGEWVTFIDPDDALDCGYFAGVAKYIDIHGRHEGLALLAAHQIRLLPDGSLVDNHPHRAKFESGSRIVDLAVEPIFQLSVNSAFFRRSVLVDRDLTFDGRVRPHFEDGHLVARYLLASDTHLLGLMASAKYHYRTREDDSSLLGSSFTEEGKYTSILRYGYLDLLQRAKALGPVPRWLENTVLYELFWMFKAQLAIHSLSASAPAHVFPEFHELVGRILRLIAPDAIRSFDFIGVQYAIRMALLYGYNTEQPFRSWYVRFTEVDEVHQLVKLEYWFSGELPDEQIVVDDREQEPEHATVQDFEFYGRVVMRKRFLWVQRRRQVQVRLDGALRSIGRWEQQPTSEGLTPGVVNQVVSDQRKRVRPRFSAADIPYRRYLRQSLGAWWRSHRWSSWKVDNWLMACSLRLPSVRRRFAHAWALMDKNDHANDNAEHLYRFLARERPQVNSWFILERDSPSWSRLQAEGFRLVAHGSRKWKQLLLSADHFASSHADYYVTHPINRRRYGQPRYFFTFLQHGVIQDDLSRWLNGKDPHLFVTTTVPEYESIAGPGPYKFSSKETKLTGLPRHDELLRKRAAASERDRIVVIPTWRQYLVGDRVGGANERARIDRFGESEYARRYSSLLNSERLTQIAAATGKRIALMPHPHMRPYLAEFALPDGIEVLDFGTDDVQEVLASAAFVVTDYSSIAFDAAFVDIPLAYYQFDKADFWGGKNPRRQGYFDYERDGFGPVVADEATLVDMVAESAQRAFVVSEPFASRASTAFAATRDGESSRRVYEAMRALEGYGDDQER
ncbi:CDP-glycerol glycerophosphotransferase (TagB/SpsB family) [Curtobacterium sp. JUb34]|uniref:bifunctional glycosyltransferase/CDP-glycerol:glycerophosphate glycerophosphotransferase n=1 Tax=Curtobacterium sp. JUb34 TaxID=2485109 RepID=UPI000F463B3B|nr:CDP-glycerol glycerophosphotransferase family protein [Curtobacterium sp. JUb34]ROR33690.1 CDP-glycerol glycerophosphotransferase (TagB/SpsB family) [Curtobacterium sp. JUb34]